MQLHSAVTSSSSLTGTPDDVPQLPVGQAPGSPGAVTRSARLASLHRAPSSSSSSSGRKRVIFYIRTAKRRIGCRALSRPLTGRPEK